MPFGTAVDYAKLKKKQTIAKLKTVGLTVALSSIVAGGVCAVGKGRAAERKEEAKRQIIAERIYNYGEEAGWQLPINESSTLWDIRQKAVFCNEMQVKCYKDYLNDLRMYIEGTQNYGRDWVKDSLISRIQCANEAMYNAENEGVANVHLAQKQRHLKIAETMETIWKEDAQFRKKNQNKLPFQREAYLKGLLTDIHKRQAEADKAQCVYQAQKHHRGR